ncbi:ABC transporter substrate-binding protein [Bacteriovorax sp. Seq25_V]|uniref:ABC transporter substrate-binding protein n=1 Tax=Bacteriovorax sp. Seq25_V TaxID=1201288 RepID=UPI00038A3B24|nr:ABC transporter substrate-binding protein [Bacteriovorax sp. Seq25_V]EQC43381.1 ABC transporter, substrate-binding protein, family 5 [Bacteriovorax sp. Seq25_V]
MKNFKLFIVFSFFTLFEAHAYKLAISSAPNNLSPFFSTDANSQNINRLVNTSLIDFDQKMNIICRLCTSYKEKRDGNKYSIEFDLRDDVKFWDGSAVNADSVVLSHKYFTDTEKLKSVFRFAFGNIIEVKKLGDYKVELVYNKFGLDHLPNLVLFKIVKITNFDSLEKIELGDIIGAGEYKFGQIDSFHVNLIPLDKKLPALDFVVVKDETTLSLKMMKGEIDISLAEMSPRKIEFLEKSNAVRVEKKESTNYNYIGINHQKDYFKDKRVREALSLLVPREKIVTYKFKNNATIANGLFSEAFENLYIDRVEEYNPKKAEKLFMQAGFKKVDGKWMFNNQPLKLLWKSTNNKFALELVEIIKEEMKKFGIEVELVVQEWGTFLRGLKRGEYDLFIGKWVGFTGPDMLKFAFYSENIPPKGANRGFYKNSELDQQLDLAESTENIEKRNELYRQASMLVNNDYAYINLWHPSVIWVMKSCIKIDGMYPNGNMLALRNISDDCGKR